MESILVEKAQRLNHYEIVYILHADLREEQKLQEIEKYQTLLLEQGAQQIIIQNLGRCRLSNPIKKHQDGIYVQMNFQAKSNLVATLERAMRLSDRVIRYLTLKQIQKPVEPSALPIT
uniref:Ribosomal protein S6 n=1 Tax=Cyanoptyche gloeocystis TaxID=77922 RepID=A0A3G1IWA4_9EUKA|nr:ribosomal protein S6 [Cyanoptyche gloeocystis]ASQ40329.1 ribosomal protein S6 [Cyanoptyche gloeocystis]|mmetsp:Transcript_9577/g.16525  ORF Transcript_9577/g.16525 Transcript_9577/m.16525 type:complete len:118 (+) Transcript_9577:1115-1468(+)